MTLELVPLVLGALVVLGGAGLVADGWMPDSEPRVEERRRRARAARHCGGEMLIGLGLVACGGALLGRDAWRYGTVAVLVGVLLVVAGAALNARYLAERLTNRGVARRGRDSERRRRRLHDREVPLAIGADADRRSEDRRHPPAGLPAEDVPGHLAAGPAAARRRSR